jgi:uncharacterized protein (TIGR03437 family)
VIRAVVLLVLFGVPVSAARLRPYDPVIPLAFEENRGQSDRQYQHLVTHRNIGFSCQAIYWPDTFGPGSFGIPNVFTTVPIVRIVGAPASCPSRLLDDAGSKSLYYRDDRIAYDPVSRFRRLHYSLPQAEIEYRATADGLIAEFTFPSLQALHSFRFGLENLRYLEWRDQLTSTGTAPGAWTFRSSRGILRLVYPAATGFVGFEVQQVDSPNSPITVLVDIPLPKTSLGNLNGTVDEAGNWYATGAIHTYSQYDVSAAVCLSGSDSRRCPDAFVAKFNREAELQYIVYLMGQSSDAGQFVRTSPKGVYAGGVTYSADFAITPGVLQEVYAGPFDTAISRRATGGDVFLTKIDRDTGALVYSTFIGLAESESLTNMQVDDAGRAYLGIDSQSPDFPFWGEPLVNDPTCFRYAFTVRDTCSFFVSLDEHATGLRFSKQLSGFPISPPGDGVLITQSGLVRISPEGDLAASLPIPEDLRIIGFASAPDQTIWASAYRGAGNTTGFLLARLTPGGTQFEIVSDRIPASMNIEIDSSGNLWMFIPSYHLGSPAALPSDFAPTPDAPFLRPVCDSCGALIKVSPSAAVLFATYLPPETRTVSVGPNDEVRLSGTAIYVLDMEARAAPVVTSIQDNGGSSAEYTPGNVITMLGTAIGPQSEVTLPLDNAGKVTTEWEGVRVLVNDHPSPLLFAGPNRITFMVSHSIPNEPGLFPGTLVLQHDGVSVSSSPIYLGGEGWRILFGPTAPPGYGVFNDDGTQNSATNPAKLGSTLRFYVVAAGPYDQPIVDGEMQHSTLAKPIRPIQILLGDPAEILSIAQSADRVSGVMEVRVRAPMTMPITGPTLLDIVFLNRQRPRGARPVVYFAP